MKTTTARPSARGVLLAGIAVLALILSMLSPLSPTSVAPAQANPSTGFDPGNIIDDAVFYDGAAWDSAQIQSFLNQRVARCTIGDPGRAPWSPYNGTYIASVCLKDARFTTATRAANAYCKAYAGGTSESVATIISKVSRACGISPKVLMVMLEKEQSLITDTWPTARQYDVAMGYACPDSGPNNSANCDPSQTGFPQQVYRAAWQLQVYKAFPNSYNYKPFQSNTIQWHPNPGCGTSSVYISNWATAALYIYTPYRPNQAALNAGWGTGDACSSYGNRNFYNFYTSWFGSVRGGVLPDAKFASHWNANGGAAGKYGKPVANAVDHGSTVLTQEFERGTMYYNSWLGVTAVNGAINTHYKNLDTVKKLGPWGALGYPVGGEISVAGGVRQKFTNGEIYWSERTGAQAMNGGILNFYLNNGGAGGKLGFPKTRMASVSANGGGWYQEFVGGVVIVSKTNSATTSLSNGPFLRNYQAAGFVQGRWGWPTAAAKCGLTAGGCTMQTTSGAVAYSAATGSHLVPTSFLSTWGSPASALGYPTTEPLNSKSGIVQEFQGGILMLSGGVVSSLSPEVARAWRDTGDGMRWLGAIDGAPKRVDAQRYYVDFERGSLFFTSGQPAIRFGGGEFRRTYEANGGPNGPWGWPTQSAVCNDRGVCTMNFTAGQAVYSPNSGVAFLTTEYLALWRQFGGYAGSLKYPVGSVQKLTGGTVQKFEGGNVYVSQFGKVRFGTGTFLRTYLADNGPAGAWGWPVSSAVCTSMGGDCTMEFANGTAHYTPARGVWFVSNSASGRSDTAAPPSDHPEVSESPVPEQPDSPVEEEPGGVEPPVDDPSGTEGVDGATPTPSEEADGGR